LTAGLQVLRSENCLAALPAVSCPVLLIHGREDKVCPFGAAEEMLELLPDAKLAAIEGCGHVPFLGREEEIAEEIRRWRHGCQVE
jgi:pimeloyl-[acyl-carrier protein] methyl ester esterase